MARIERSEIREIKRDVNNSGGYAVIALALKAHVDVAKNDPDAAIANLDAAIKLEPNRPALYLDRGSLWRGKGDSARAHAIVARS